MKKGIKFSSSKIIFTIAILLITLSFTTSEVYGHHFSKDTKSRQDILQNHW